MREKTTKKNAKKYLIPILFVLLLIIVEVSTRNQRLLNSMMQSFLTDIKKENNIQVIEAQSIYGKLIGNGNGIQYFGAVLIQSSEESNVESLKSKLIDNYDVVDYCIQNNQRIDCDYIGHGDLEFTFALDSNEKYYCIYFYNSFHPYSNLADIAGH